MRREQLRGHATLVDNRYKLHRLATDRGNPYAHARGHQQRGGAIRAEFQFHDSLALQIVEGFHEAALPLPTASSRASVWARASKAWRSGSVTVSRGLPEGSSSTQLLKRLRTSLTRVSDGDTILHTNDTHGHIQPFTYPDAVAGRNEMQGLKVHKNIGGIARRTKARDLSQAITAPKRSPASPAPFENVRVTNS